MASPLMLIDGYAQIYRGYYAIRHLSSPDGQPTNAIFAIAKFLIRLESDYPSDLGAFALDKGKPAFRLKLAPDYKGNRPPMPDDLRSQLEPIRELIGLFGWPIFEHEGLEADDIIAGIAAHIKDVDVRIVSHDKDIAQVVSNRVQMLIPDRKTKGLSLQGPKEVLEKFSVHPNQIIDYLSLIGDSSDNIPGVAGVGPKTAAKLINEFGSIDSMLNNLKAISNVKLREKLENAKELLAKNINLVRLKTDISELPSIDLSTLKKKTPDKKKLIEFAEKYSLKSIVKDLNSSLPDKLEEDLFLSPALSTQESPAKQSSKEKYTPDLFDISH
jgi:DNA polymerase-1